MVRGVNAVGVVEHLVEEVLDFALGHHEPASPGELHRVSGGCSVERGGHRGPPIDHHRIATFVLHVTATDVPRVASLIVEAPEAEAVHLDLQGAQTGLQVHLRDGRVNGTGR